MKHDGTWRDFNQHCDIGDRLSLCNPCEALSLALRQIDSNGLARRTIKRDHHMRMKVQPDKMDDIVPFSHEPLRIRLALTSCQRESGHPSKSSPDRHSNAGSNPEGRR